MEIMLKGNNGEKVVIPIEDLIQKYWSDENSKPTASKCLLRSRMKPSLPP